MRRAATALAVAVAAVASACGGGEALPEPTPTKPGALPANLTTITVTDNRFQPRSLQVPVGTRVTWSFRGEAAHQVVGTFEGSAVDSGPMRRGNFEFEFTAPGTFAYRCGIHGEAMAGEVIVR
ncbi:cupredoxin domain-containing protein [Tepidiforma sp.]|uniref:cupredoxin domain-containing protein n=1 Tax=Tepidiforma sp. TaxID=2682230 RepID=UPI002ADDD200|nr:cupredoxin domain-containing protein [Tepidiforma sp.]